MREGDTVRIWTKGQWRYGEFVRTIERARKKFRNGFMVCRVKNADGTWKTVTVPPDHVVKEKP